MPGPEQIASAGLSGVSAAYKLINSIRKGNQAKKLERQTKRPVYNRPEETDKVYDLALSEIDNNAMQDYTTDQLNQGLSSGIDAILKSGGKADFDTINNSYGKNLKAAIYSISKDRDARVAAFNNAAYNKGQAKDAEFMYNKDAPYKDVQKQIAALRQEQSQSANEAFSLAAGGLANYANANLRPGQYGVSDIPENIASPDRMLANPQKLSYRPASSSSSSMSIQPSFKPTAFPDNAADGGEITGFDEWGEPIFAN